MPKHCRRLDTSVGVSERYDFAVRLPCVRLAHDRHPPHPASNVRDDRPNAPLGGRDARKNASDLPDITSEMACDKMARRANHLPRANSCQAQSSRVPDPPRHAMPLREKPEATSGCGSVTMMMVSMAPLTICRRTSNSGGRITALRHDPFITTGPAAAACNPSAVARASFRSCPRNGLTRTGIP
jgi:hypothetical protein